MASSFPLFDPIGRRAALDEDGLYTVSGLTAQIRAVLEGDFGEVGLTGEVSNLARPRSGHVYFSLKDDSAQIRAVLWKADARRVVFDLEDGLAVRAWGGLTVYEPRGEYQVIIKRLEPVGIGPLELAFRQVVQRLAAEGLFDPGRKRPLPRFPRRIVVVSSPTGAAVRDFLKVTGRRWPSAEVLLAPSRVQGEGAAAEIAAAIALANRVPGVDFVVLARGGGSLEDLWAFNEEIVARAIFASALPVVSAVGHEIDTTVADLVADVRAPTPSAAGEMCVPDAAEVLAGRDGLRDRMARALSARARDARAGLDRLADRAQRALAIDLDRKRRDLARLAAQLEALSPLGVLARGYSLTQRLEDGAVVRSPADAPAGTRLRTRLAAGEVVSQVVG
jgi:exodeoxyribonuclease VII large subunit